MIRGQLALLLSIAFALGARGACPTVSFAPPAGFGPHDGVNPILGSVDDVNGDGRSDVTLFYNDFFGGFQTFLANEDGTFASRPAVRTDSATALDIGDIDGDGRVDAVVAVVFNILLYSGNGDGAWAPKGTIPVGVATTDLLIADLNGDGLAELIAFTAAGPATVVVYVQTAPWTFTAGMTVPYSVHADEPRLIDLDRDGHLDLLFVASNNIEIFYGRGDATFDRASITLPTTPEDSPHSATTFGIGDVDHDGDPDILAGQLNNGVAIFLGDGGRSFHLDRRLLGRDVLGFSGAAGAREVEYVDLNADGIADLIVSTYGGYYTLLGKQTGFFEPAVFHPVAEYASGPVDRFRSTPADFRGDGRTDLVVNSTAIWLNTCAPPPTITAIAPGSGPATGGTVVTITGTSLLSTTQVLFGSTPGTILDTSATSVSVRTPASVPSTVDVTVTTSGGTATRSHAFRFLSAAEIAGGIPTLSELALLALAAMLAIIAAMKLRT